ncbi:MAG TPA: tagatose 1,6-diphosphate aldolase [Solibacterales bacterium]|nr:tagatose 1,6-diphosphate aldolase [Bryobacterales bacterium]
MPLSEAKAGRLRALSNSEGVIAAIAMDQRGSLRKAIAAAKGVHPQSICQESMREFKSAVAKVLTPHASAILLDPDFGLEAAALRHPRCGLLLAYEASGYDNTRPGRRPDLLPGVSVHRLCEWGAGAVKIVLYYSPFDDPQVNEEKHAFIERIGAECHALELPFFLEFVGYDPAGGDEKGPEYARRKPEIVTRSIAEFTQDRYRADVLKVEAPVNLDYVEGTPGFKGIAVHSRREALDHFREAGAATRKPFIYLSAGVSTAQFMESLGLAVEAGSGFSGVLCGRSTWKDGIPVYARHGASAFEEWLALEGVRNIAAINEVLRSATPWFSRG